jgi:hypothetical protein
VAKVHDGDSVQALQWVEATLTRLYLGHVGAVLGGLRRYERNSNQMLALRCAKYNGTFNQALSVINSGYGKRKKHRMLLF